MYKYKYMFNQNLKYKLEFKKAFFKCILSDYVFVVWELQMYLDFSLILLYW